MHLNSDHCPEATNHPSWVAQEEVFFADGLVSHHFFGRFSPLIACLL